MDPSMSKLISRRSKQKRGACSLQVDENDDGLQCMGEVELGDAMEMVDGCGRQWTKLGRMRVKLKEVWAKT